MISGEPASMRATLGGDRGYDTRGFVEATRKLNVTPHVAQNNSHRRSAIDERTTRHDGWRSSERRAFADLRGWAGCSPSRLPLTTLFGCATFRWQTSEEKCARTAKNPSFRPGMPLCGAHVGCPASPNTASNTLTGSNRWLFPQPASDVGIVALVPLDCFGQKDVDVLITLSRIGYMRAA